MQRLIGHTDRERGAVAVVVALLMVPLIGFTALAIDVASMWSQQQRLQVAADASALAIAQDCAHKNCGTPESTAASMTNANFGSGATGTVNLDSAHGKVTVQTATVSHHLFAPVLGVDSTNVSASASAAWGPISGGPAVLPLTVSACEFTKAIGGGVPTAVQAIPLAKIDDPACPGWTAPGGFGWVDVDDQDVNTDADTSGDCTYDSQIGQDLSSDSGKSVSNGCSEADIKKHLGQTVLLPIFDTVQNTGTNVNYHVYGYAAFQFVGYDFQGNHDGGSYSLCSAYGNQDCLQGSFVKLVDIDDAYSYSIDAPDLGSIGAGLTG